MPTTTPIIYAAFEVRFHGLKLDPGNLEKLRQDICSLLDSDLNVDRDPDRGHLPDDVEVDILETVGGDTDRRPTDAELGFATQLVDRSR